MNCTRRDFLAIASGAAALACTACSSNTGDVASTTEAATTQASTVDLTEFKDLAIDMSAWRHDDENDVWWQTGLEYCKEPAAKSIETLGIYVPGPYMDGKQASGDKYTCTIKEDAQVGAYTSSTAPIVMPVNAAGFSVQAAPTTFSYSGLEKYLSAGLIYVYVGLRGRGNGYDSSATSGDGFFSGGSPWAVVDLKAAVRYLRYNAKSLPGDATRVFPFGHSAGGSLVSILGSTGDAPYYDAYLKKVGAATHDADGTDISDTVAGVACWCPDTGLSQGDAAYEWAQGQYFAGGTRAEGTWTGLLSDDLASAYAAYVNSLDLRDGDGNHLTLDETDGVIYADGSYYEYMVTLAEDSLARFLADTTFPYTSNARSVADGGFAGDGTTADEATATAASQSGSTTDQQVQNPVTYGSASDYLDALNSDSRWVVYNESKGTVRITSLEAFVQHCRIVTKDVCAYDSISRSNVYNQLFGNDDSDSLHFSQVVSDLLANRVDAYATAADWDASLPEAWSSDLKQTDSLKNPLDQRRDMYDPLYYLSGAFQGFGSAKVASHWRINAGLSDPETPMTAEANLALALIHYDGVSDVTLTEVWDKGRELAERSGDAIDNLVAWVGACCSQ